jgi:hypothetical protein
MAVLSIGSLVRPLNETGEGVVSAFRKDGMVLVTMHDGFEIPFPPNQLVVIRSAEMAPGEQPAKPVATSAEMQQPGLFFAFSFEGMEKDQAKIGLSLVNQTDAELVVIVYNQKGKQFFHEVSAILPAGSIKRLSSGNLSALLERDRFYVQVNPTLRETTAIPGGWSGYVKHQIPSLIDPAAWPQQNNLSMRALMIRIFPDTKPDTFKVVPKEQSETILHKTTKDWLLNDRDGHFEVDLHIEELIDDASGMDNASMIQYQLRHFNKCLDEAKNRKLWKFIAIHGVGKGVLRNEIRQLIKSEGLKFQDASYQRYGYGATEVLMR